MLGGGSGVVTFVCNEQHPVCDFRFSCNITISWLTAVTQFAWLACSQSYLEFTGWSECTRWSSCSVTCKLGAPPDNSRAVWGISSQHFNPHFMLWLASHREEEDGLQQVESDDILAPWLLVDAQGPVCNHTGGCCLEEHSQLFSVCAWQTVMSHASPITTFGSTPLPCSVAGLAGMWHGVVDTAALISLW